MGMINSILQKRFSNVFIVITTQKNEYILKCKIIKSSKIIKEEEKQFIIKSDENSLPEDMKDFINSLQKEYKFVYITYLLDTLGQGCLPTCKEEEMSKFEVDPQKIEKICIDNESWSIYALKTDIKWINDRFVSTGLDMIISPFLVFYNVLKKKKDSLDKKTLHLLYMENFLIIMIFANNKILFNAFFKIPHKEYEFDDEEDLTPEDSEEITDGIELENIESEDEEFEGFVDITKLDEEQDDHEEGDILSTTKEEMESLALDDLELYGREVIIFKYLQSAIDEYYKNPLYDSDFLDSIMIYNDSNISNDIITMIENDLFLNVEIFGIDMKEEMIKVSLEEVGL